MTLPVFLTAQNKYKVGAFFYGLAGLLYLGSNHFPLFTPQELPIWAMDKAVPFIPWMVWIYVSEYIFFCAIYITCRDLVNANKYLYSFMALQTVSVLIFWAWPTTYPRYLFPLHPESMDSLTYWVFSTLRSSDSPNNCCPSLHVSSVFLSSFIYLDDQRRKFPFFFLWALLIAASTLPTKQHYTIDVVLGFIMAVLFYVFFHRCIKYRQRPDTTTA